MVRDVIGTNQDPRRWPHAMTFDPERFVDREPNAYGYVPHGGGLLGDDAVGPGKAFERDPLVMTIDVRDLGISGFQAAEITRAKHHVDFGAADSHRVTARFTHSDGEDTAEVLVRTLNALVGDAEDVEKPHPVLLPSAHGLELETVMTPRDAFFARVEQVPIEKAEGGWPPRWSAPTPQVSR